MAKEVYIKIPMSYKLFGQEKMHMKKKYIRLITGIIVAGIGLAGVVYQTKNPKEESVSKTENNNENNIAPNFTTNINNYPSEKTENTTDVVEKLKEEKNKLEDQLEKAKSDIEELENIQKQNEEDINRYEKTNADIEDQLEKVNQQLTQAKEENKTLNADLRDVKDVDFLDQQIYVEGNKILDIKEPIASIDGNIYYSDEIVEEILGRYGTEYSYTDTQIDIKKNVDATKLPLSQAEVYEKDNCVSTGSGSREDVEGNQFSGVLINDRGGISFLVNEKYEKMSGVIHVAKETPSDFSGTIRIIIYDKDGNSKDVYESPTLTKLSEEQTFMDEKSLDIKGAKVVRIEQNAVYPVDVVISDAFFYNE